MFTSYVNAKFIIEDDPFFAKIYGVNFKHIPHHKFIIPETVIK